MSVVDRKGACGINAYVQPEEDKARAFTNSDNN